MRKDKQTAIGLKENTTALLSYLITFVTGIIFLIIEKENKFVRFHAMQSLLTFLPLFILSYIVKVIPLIGEIVSFIITISEFILWIFLMCKAYSGEWFKLPIIGRLAQQKANTK